MICLAFSVNLAGQEFEAPASREAIASWLDFAAYKIDNYQDYALVEFYYGLLRHQLTFEDKDSLLDATAYVWLEILNNKGVVVDTLYKKIATQVPTSAEANNPSFRILDALQALMRPGEYSVRLTIEDANSQEGGVPFTGKYAEQQIKVVIPNYNEKKLQLSDVELAYKIEMLDEGDTLSTDPLKKSNRHVIPNPSRIFINTDSLLYFYAEIYNLKFGKEANREYYVQFKVEDYLGGLVADYGIRRYYKPGTSAVISSAIDISDLPEGKFTFILEVTDPEDGSDVSASKEFNLIYQTYELAPAVAEEDFSDKDAQLMKKMIHYYASNTVRDQYDAADLNGKKEILRRFWDAHDPNPNTRLNEFKVQVFRLFNMANQKYSVNLVDKSDGWKTDRGRVLMVYGEPDEIEFVPSSPQYEPFERWTYFRHPQQGYIYFIFVDETGFGNYILKHSTAQGEITDSEWENRLQSIDPFNTGY